MTINPVQYIAIRIVMYCLTGGGLNFNFYVMEIMEWVHIYGIVNS